MGLALALLGFSGALWYLHGRLTSFIQDELLPEWRSRYDAHVTVDHASVRVFPSVRIVARGVRFQQNGREGAPPLLHLRQLIATASIPGIIRSPRRLRSIEIDGLELNRPPRGQGPLRKEREGTDRNKFVVGRIVADNSVLRLLHRTSDPTVLHFRKVRLHGTGGVDGDVRYETEVAIPKPPGTVRSSGVFGPWNTTKFGDMRVSGKYELAGADLAAFPPVAGKLVAAGEFNGVLRRMEVNGQAAIPDFRVVEADHPVQFDAEYRTVVDGRTGDVAIQSLDARFLQSAIHATGEVVGEKDKVFTLQAQMSGGRLEDVLRFLLKDPSPPFTGTAGFDWKYSGPLTGKDLVERIRLTGTVRLDDVRPARAAMREKLNELSAKGQGEPDASVQARADVSGTLDVRDGVAHLSNVLFRTEGVAVRLAGTYGLRSRRIDLSGTARLEAKVSERRPA